MIPLQPLRAALLAAGFAAALAFSAIVPAAAISPAERSEVEKIIKEYLLQNPEVLRDAMIELQRRQQAAEAQERADAVKSNRALIFDSPRGVVIGNPKGDVTIVEFFDYNCGYCKRALSDMDVLLKADPQLKFVMKEFPVLGPGSLEAAKVAVAVRMQDKDGSKYPAFHRRLLGTRGEANRERAMAAAKEAGLDLAQIEKDLKSEEIDATLLESVALADALGISGTPSYVIGDQVVPGAVGADALRRQIDAVRKCGTVSC
ncbi:MAG: DsbA family protein [Bradyrhizobiaceae bacterium]|nr:DsbA family protein [Bradyrhizobiaceae bacterium]